MRVSLENKVESGSREQTENTSTYFPHKVMRNDRKGTSEKVQVKSVKSYSTETEYNLKD